MQKKMILIVGKSGTGKDYLAKAFGLRMVVSHTTRPMRKGDVNGKTKWFHNELPFKMNKQILEAQLGLCPVDIIAYTFFDHHWYWATERDLLNKDAYIIDVAGIDFMAQKYGKYFDDIFSIVYVSCAWWKRLYRIIKRDGLRKGAKRFVHDIGKFKGIENYDYTAVRN